MKLLYWYLLLFLVKKGQKTLGMMLSLLGLTLTNDENSLLLSRSQHVTMLKPWCLPLQAGNEQTSRQAWRLCLKWSGSRGQEEEGKKERRAMFKKNQQVFQGEHGFTQGYNQFSAWILEEKILFSPNGWWIILIHLFQHLKVLTSLWPGVSNYWALGNTRPLDTINKICVCECAF